MDYYLIAASLIVVMIPFLMFSNYVFLKRTYFLPRLHKFYIIDILILVFFITFYIFNKDITPLINVIIFVIIIGIIIWIQTIYFQKNILKKYEIYFRKSKDILDIRSTLLDYQKEFYLTESHNGRMPTIQFSGILHSRITLILNVLSMNKKLFYSFENRKFIVIGILKIVLTITLIIALFLLIIYPGYVFL